VRTILVARDSIPKSLYNPLMRLPSQVRKAIDAILTQPGATETSLRRAVLERSRSNKVQVPELLLELVDKVAERPWTVTDEDFNQLRTAGYSEEHIFEVTMTAALGAGLQRFDAGLRALEENGGPKL
jgi:alkylhydroperoxidase family enzyme